MTDPDPTPGPPLVTRVEEEPPLVLMAEPVSPPPPARPWPGFWGAVLTTLGFAVVLFGVLIGVVFVAAFVLGAVEGPDAFAPPPGVAAGTVAALPPAVVEALAIAFPVAYAASLVYAAVMLRCFVGRGWARAVGLGRLPPAHLALAVFALPGFVVLSDALAALLFRLFESDPKQTGDLGEIFRSFHWSFAVLAIGVGPGVVEELWCRGFLGRGLVGRYGWLGGVALTSLFFGALHMYPLAYVLVTAAMGGALHFVYAMSRSLWVPVAVHLLNNSFAGLVAVKAIPADGMERAMADNPVLGGGLAAATLVCAGIAMWTGRARVRPVPGSPGEPPHRGVMVPPPESGAELVAARPSPLASLSAAAASAGLVWVLCR